MYEKMKIVINQGHSRGDGHDAGSFPWLIVPRRLNRILLRSVDRYLSFRLAPKVGTYYLPPLLSPAVSAALSSALAAPQILLHPPHSLSPILCHAPVTPSHYGGHRPPGMWRSPSRPPQWLDGWRMECHHRGIALVSHLLQPGPTTRATSTLAYSNPSPSSHGSAMVRTGRRGLVLAKRKRKRHNENQTKTQ